MALPAPALPAWTTGTAYAVGTVVASSGAYFMQPWVCTVKGAGNSVNAPNGGATADGYTWIAVGTTGWDSSAANKVIPASGVTTAGFATDAEIAATLMNWLLWTIEQWLALLNGLFGYALTWAGLNTFQAGVAITGGGLSVIGGETVDVLNPVTFAPTRVPLALSGVLTAFQFKIDATLGTVFAITSMHSGGNNVFIACTVAEGAAFQLPIGSILILKDESGTAGAKNVTINSPAGNTMNIDGSPVSITMGTNYEVGLRIYYAGSAGGVDNWFTF